MDKQARINLVTVILMVIIAVLFAVFVMAAPTGTVGVGTAVIYSGDLIQEITVTYDEVMDNATDPTIAFEGSALLSPNADAVWNAANTSWTRTFTHSGAAEAVVGVNATSSVANNLSGSAQIASINSTFNIDTILPTVVVTMNASAFKIGETAIVTFTFSEAPTGFTLGDLVMSSANGAVSLLNSSNTLIQTATFTPDNGVEDTSNIITVGTDWTDAALNAPSTTSDSPNYNIDTKAPACPIPTIAEINSLGLQYATGSTVYYSIGASPQNGTFNVSVAATDDGSGVANVTFPLTVSPGAAVLSAPYFLDYNWNSGDSLNYTPATITCYDNAGNANTTIFNVYADNSPLTWSFVNLNVSYVKNGTSVAINSDAADAGSGLASCHAYWSTDTSASGDTDIGDLGTDCDGDVIVPNSTAGTYYIVLAYDGNPGIGLGDNVGYFTNVYSSAITFDNTVPIVTIDVIPNYVNTITYNVTGTYIETNLQNISVNGVLATIVGLNYSALIPLASDTNITINVSILDLAGNTNSTLDWVVRDIVAPTGDVSVGTALISDGDLVQEVTVTYDEPMDPLSTPSIGWFMPPSTATTQGDGTWANATRWTETFNISDADDTFLSSPASSYWATDLAGNVESGFGVQDTFDIDTQNPTVVLSSSTANPTNGLIAVTAQFSENVTGFNSTDNITITNGVAESFVIVNATTYTFNVNPTDGANVAVTIDVLTNKSLDVATNLNTASNTLSYTSDTVAPTYVSIELNDTALKIGETALVTITFAENVTGFNNSDITTINNGALSAVTSTDGNVTWTGIFTPNTIENATNIITVTLTGLTDLAGNAGVGTNNSANYAIDTIAPTGYSVSIDQVYINNANKAAMSFTFAGAEVGATYNVTISDSNGSTSDFTQSGAIGSTTQQILGIDISGLSDGTLNLSVTLTDLAGNLGLATTDNVTKDVVAPDADVYSLYVTGGAAYVPGTWTNKIIYLRLNCSDATSGCRYVWYYGYGGNPMYNLSAPFNDSLLDYTSDSFRDTNFTYLGEDFAGNNGTVEKISIKLDRINPILVLNGPNPGLLTSNNNISFNITANDTTLANCSLYKDGSFQGVFASLNNGTPTVYNLIGDSDGLHTWNVTCFDLASNSNVSATRNYTVDTTPPSLNVTDPVDGSYWMSTSVAFTFNASDPNLANCTIVDNFSNSFPYAYPGSINNGTFSTVGVTLQEGVHVWNITCYDTLGHSTTSTSKTVIVDVTPVNITSVSITPDNFVCAIYGNASDLNNEIYLQINATDDVSGVDEVEADFSSVGGSSALSLAFNAGTGLWEVKYNVTSTATNNFDPANITIEALDNAGNGDVGQNTTTVLLYNMTNPPSTDPCERDTSSTTNMCDETDFNHVNYIKEIEANGSESCNGQELPWGDEFKKVVTFNFSDVNFSDPATYSIMSQLASAFVPYITPPGAFGDSYIFVNSTAFAALNRTTTVTLYGVPFSELPIIMDENGAIPISSILDMNEPYVIEITCADDICPDVCIAAGYTVDPAYSLCVASCIADNCTSADEFNITVPNANLTITVSHFSQYNESDDANPLVAINEPVVSFVTNNPNVTLNVTVNGTGTTLSNITFLVESNVIMSLDGNGVYSEGLCTNNVDDWSTVTCSEIATGLADGNHTLSVLAFDHGGSQPGNSNSTESIIFTVDTTAPAVTVVSPNSYINTSSVTFNISSIDATTTATDCWMDISGTNQSMTKNGNYFDYTDPSIADGNYLANFYCNDSAGNLNNSVTKNFTKDTVAPIFTNVTSSPTSSGATIRYNSNESVNVTVNYGNTTALGNSTGLSSYALNGSVSISGLSASTAYYYNVTICDRAGNCATNGTNDFNTTARSSGGGGSSSVSNENIILTGEETTYYGLGDSDSLIFEIGGEQHTLKVKRKNVPNSADLELQSTPIPFTLNVGESRIFNISTEKLYVGLSAVKSTGIDLVLRKVVDKIPLQKLNLTYPKATQETPEAETPVKETQVEGKPVTTTKLKPNSKSGWIVTGIILVVGIGSLVIAKSRKKHKHHQEHHHNK